MNSRTVSLRRMIVVPTILLVIVSVLLVGFFSMRNGRLAVTTVSRALRTEITGRISSQINEFLNTPQILCVLTSDLIGEGFLDSQNSVQMEKWFFNLVEIYPTVSSIYFGNTAGGISDAGRETSGEPYIIRTEDYAAGKFYKYRCDSLGNPIELLDELDNFDARNRSWFTESSDSRGSVLGNDPYLVYTGNEIAISTSMAVLDPQGVFAGVVACDVFLSQLSNFLRNLQIGKTGIAFITDGSGDVLASSVNPDHNPEYTLAPASENADSIIHCVGVYADSLYGSDWDIDSVVEFQLECSRGKSFVQISPFMDSLGKSYFIVTSIPEADFQEFIEKNNRDTAILLGIALLVALITGMLVARLVAKPIHDLRSTVRHMIDGHQTEFSSHWVTEVNELSDEFRQLTMRLNKTMNDLKISEERMNLAIKGTQAAIWDWNISTGKIQINKRWAEMIGYSIDEIQPVTIDSWNDFVNPDERQEVYRRLQDHFEGKTEFYEATFRMKHKNGQWIWILDRGMVLERDASGKPSRMTGTHVDISLRMSAEIEKKRLQNQMAKTQRLESIGQLAGGVAHDLNNLLTPIIGYAEMLLDDAGKEIDTRPFMEILHAGKSAQILVNQLLAVGRKQFLELRVLDLSIIVDSFRNLIARTIREDISISFSFYNSPLLVKGDANKLEQVLMNLAVNAQDAMPEGGKMIISTDISVFPEDPDADSPQGPCAVLAISDTGSGMDPETQNKIFEPFFSLKGDKGTGLGLATVYGIVRQHGGIINVKSEKGVGSTFSILLPISDENSVALQNSVESYDLSGNETILVVEDGDEVRELSVIALKRFGYNVIEATCGSDALTIIRNNADSINLMLTDVIMPGMSLDEFRLEALALIPDLKIIYMSGYSDDIIKRIVDSGVSVPFISKPFTLTDLAKIVRSVIDKEV